MSESDVLRLDGRLLGIVLTDYDIATESRDSIPMEMP